MNLPDSFIRYTSRLMGDELYARFSDGLNEEAPVSIRINRLKSRGRSVAGTAVNVPWCGDGRYLPQRPDFTFDPLLHAGCYYVQEASSMFVHHVLRSLVSTPVLMLDMCAAPGGKSTAAASALPEGSILMSNEPVRARANILAENMMKWGSPDVIVTNNYPSDYVRSGLDYDVILCDVPCSGEGMFRKDEGAVEEWSPQNVDACSRLQREIVADAWQCLRPGGLLIYSTCTFNATENEENIRWIVDELGGMPVAVPVSEGWGICGSLLADFTAPVYRFIPGCTRGEGLFMAVLRKSPDAESPIILRKGKRYVQDKYDNGNKKRKDKAIAASLVSRDIEKIVSGWTSFVSGDEHIEPALRQSDVCVLALTPHLARLYDAASLSLRVLSAGVTLGNVKGHDIVPNHSLALSSVLCPDAFPVVPLTYTQAVAYLRRETVALPPDTPMGFVLVAWHDAVLGFVKNIGNRANNLYPQEWKIKSTHVPDREPWVLV